MRRRWLCPLLPGRYAKKALGSLTSDPIRTRAQSLNAVPASDRQQFIDNARTITETALRRLDEAVGATNRTAPAALSEIGTFASSSLRPA